RPDSDVAWRKRGGEFERSSTERSKETATATGTGTASGGGAAGSTSGVGTRAGSHCAETRASAVLSTRAPSARKPPNVKWTRPLVVSLEREISWSGFSTR